MERVLIVKAETGVTSTVAEACKLLWLVLRAVIVTSVSLVTAGAVNVPVLEIVPLVADHPTSVFHVPVTFAVNFST